jgi:electron transport complex protein RnfG
MSKRIESTLPNMIVSLTLIAMVMSALLTIVYLKTKGPIEEAAKKKEMNAIKEVSPPFDNDPTAELFQMDNITVYPVKSNNKNSGYAVKTFTEKGFGGRIELMAGFRKDGSIVSIKVLEHKETPGLGTKMSDKKFINQFIDKNPRDFILKVSKDGGKVDAITAATITSRAFCDAMQRASDVVSKLIVNDSTTTVKYQ